ncbi:MAG: serine hydrolase [Balneolales bacterium]|nr:serine hydrolase [Balneolales bacterium]
MILILIAAMLFMNPQIEDNMTSKSLNGKVIVVDPGHGGTAETDSFRVGPSGEREEWVNLRVSLLLRDYLEEAGATVLMTRTDDSAVELVDRGQLAIDNNADLFISVHHNATADTSVNFPIIYFHGNTSENKASVLLGRYLADEIRSDMFDGVTPVSLVSDHAIFPTRGARVLSSSYGIPGVITEATFFTNAAAEELLKDEEWNRIEARALFNGIQRFFESINPDQGIILDKHSITEVEPLPVFQEAERMRDEALQWKQFVDQARELLEKENATEEDIRNALDLATKSVRYFPDSYVARQAHELRRDAYQRLNEDVEATKVQNRIHQFFAPITEPNRTNYAEIQLNLPEESTKEVSALIQNSRGDILFEMNAQKQVPSASVIKIQILAALLLAHENSTIDIHDVYQIQESDVVGGSGELQHNWQNVRWTYLEYATEMIRSSDNIATNVVIRAVGMDAVNELSTLHGGEQTRLARYMMDFDAIAEGRQNYTSASDMNRFLLEVYRGNVLSPQNSRLLFEILDKCADQTMIPSGVPPHITVANKTGTLAYFRGDSAAVFADETYFISVFIENYSDVQEAEKLVAELTKQLFSKILD